MSAASPIPFGVLASGLVTPLFIFFYKLSADKNELFDKMDKAITARYQDAIVLYCIKTKKNIFKLTEEDLRLAGQIFQQFIDIDLYTKLNEKKQGLLKEATNSSLKVSSSMASAASTILLAMVALASLAAFEMLFIAMFIVLTVCPIIAVCHNAVVKKYINNTLDHKIKKATNMSQEECVEQLKKAYLPLKQEAVNQSALHETCNSLMNKFLYAKPSKREVGADLTKLLNQKKQIQETDERQVLNKKTPDQQSATYQPQHTKIRPDSIKIISSAAHAKQKQIQKTKDN